MAAVLHIPIHFCSDIRNIKDLIDVHKDDENFLLITCKLFIKRFCLSERRQVNSWVTPSWHPFTSGALRDRLSNKITCIINNNLLCQWNLDETDIESIKKYSFKSSIQKLILHEEEIYVVYNCGFIETLSSAVKTRKEDKIQILAKDEKIINIIINKEANTTKLVPIMLIEKEGGSYWLCKFTFGSEKTPFSQNIDLVDHHLIGSCLLSTGRVLTAWSDGNLYSMSTLDPDSSPNPGSLQGSLSFFNKTKKIKLMELSQSHIAIQGMDGSDDGGLVVLWDMKFGVNVSSKKMKMYRNPPLAWSVESGIVVVEGGGLIYIAVTLAPSTVASMFASRIDVAENCDECIIWSSSASNGSLNGKLSISEKAKQTIFSNKSDELVALIKSAAPGATTEDMIVRLVTSHLISEKNLKLLVECITAFSFIPEFCLVSILKYLVESKDECFEIYSSKSEVASVKKRKSTTIKKLVTKRKGKSIDGVMDRLNNSLYNNADETEDEVSVQALTSTFSENKEKIINTVLRLPFTEKQLAVNLYQLDFNSSWTLLQYLHHLLASGKARIVEDAEDVFPSVDKTCIWLSLVLDANYHQLVMTSETEIQRRLLSCEKDISNMKDFLEATHSIDPLIERVMHSQEMPVSQADASYSIERIVLP